MNRSRTRLHSLLAGLLMLLVAYSLAASETEIKTAPTANELSFPADELKQSCFYERDVSNWDVLNREYLLVYAPRKSRAFLVRIAPPSVDLRSASVLAFDSRDRVCGKAGDRLIIGRGNGSSFSIVGVWRVPEDQVDRYQENKRQRDSNAVAPAPSAPGASVETDITPNDD
jgi:hypothetical protein